MHCSNPKCFEDSCNGECEAGEDRVWPWYRYESKQEAQAETEKKKAEGLSETKAFC
jgi:hypothetical protein